MKILVICQHYWPEPYPLPDICEELVRRGHQVDLITDIPNYPMGITYPEYRNGKQRREIHNGVNITRVFTIARRHNAIFRLFNYYSYMLSSSFCAGRLKEEYDVVFANQTSPVMMSNAAFVYAKKHSRKVVMYCMDLWPACLAAGGIKETSPVYKFFGWESKRLYNKPDKILITSKMFRSYLVDQHGVESEKISYLPQYAPEQFEEANFNPVPKDTIDLMFAGNVGSAQNLTVVLAAAEILRDEKCLRWHIVGDGSELENLKKEAAEKHLENVVFYGRKASSEMPRYYAHADAMLVTLMDDPFISLTLPGKVQTYMAAGKPIIASAVGETPLVIDEAKCGYCAKANDAQALADVVRTFMHCSNKLQLGKNARAYYEQHFSKRTFMDRLEKELQMN